MARDDYFVIVYQILAYLYQTLKNGEDVKPAYLKADSPLFGDGINTRYWRYIMRNIVEQGFVSGIIIDEIDNALLVYGLEKAEITPKGIEYLCDNSTFAKVKRFFKEAKEMLPCI